MREAGKGSKPRPLSVDQETYKNNYDRIFGKKEEPPKELPSNIQERLDVIAEKLEQLHQEILTPHDTSNGQTEGEN